MFEGFLTTPLIWVGKTEAVVWSRLAINSSEKFRKTHWKIPTRLQPLCKRDCDTCVFIWIICEICHNKVATGKSKRPFSAEITVTECRLFKMLLKKGKVNTHRLLNLNSSPKYCFSCFFIFFPCVINFFADDVFCVKSQRRKCF